MPETLLQRRLQQRKDTGGASLPSNPSVPPNTSWPVTLQPEAPLPVNTPDTGLASPPPSMPPFAEGIPPMAANQTFTESTPTPWLDQPTAQPVVLLTDAPIINPEPDTDATTVVADKAPVMRQRDEAPKPSSSRLAQLNQRNQPSVPVGGSPTADDETYRQFRVFEERISKQLSVNAEMTELKKDESNPHSQQRVRDILRALVQAETDLPPGYGATTIVDILYNNVMGFGPIQPLLDDHTVDEIMVNGPKDIWVERHGKLSFVEGVRFRDDTHARQIIDRILAPMGRRCDESLPFADGRLPDGSRVNAVISPVSLNGAVITIRKFREQMTPELLLSYGSISEDVLAFIQACVVARLNLLIAGGTGSGKTSLLNVCGSFIPPDQRIISIENPAELRLPIPHWVRLETKDANVEGQGAISTRTLVQNALRMRPDRILVGECRGPEALDMIQAMNTGHEGSLTTVHANSPNDAIHRLNTMVLLAGEELPYRAINEQIAAAMDLIIYQSRMRDGSRKITAITEVVGMGTKKFADSVWTRDLFTFHETSAPGSETVVGSLVPTGKVPHFLPKLSQYGYDFSTTFFERSPLLPSVAAGTTGTIGKEE